MAMCIMSARPALSRISHEDAVANNHCRAQAAEPADVSIMCGDMAEVRLLQTRYEQLRLSMVAVDYGHGSSLALAGSVRVAMPRGHSAGGAGCRLKLTLPCATKAVGFEPREVTWESYENMERCRTLAGLEQPARRRRTVESSMSRYRVGR